MAHPLIRALPVVLLALGAAPAAAEPPVTDEATVAGIVETYKRSMLHWKIDYDGLTPNRAGAACVPWDALDGPFLAEGIFEALGYGWQIATEEVAARAALEGCERMRRGRRLGATCTCELVLYNDEVRLGSGGTGR